MPSSATASLRLELQATGENAGTWGTRVNDSVTSLVEEAVAGVLTKSLTGNVTLTSTNFASDEARHAVLVLTDGGLSAVPTVTIPAVEKVYVVHNKGATYAITFTAGGTTASVAASTLAWLYCDGTDVFAVAPGVVADLYAALADNETITGIWTFTATPRFQTAVDFYNTTWGGQVGRIAAGTTGNWLFEPTSAADTLDTAKTFLYNNTSDRWEAEHDFLVGNDFTVSGNATITGTLTQTGVATFNAATHIQDDGSGLLQFDNTTWGGRAGRIFASNSGDIVFRPTSAADTDDGTKDFLYNNTTDRWEVDDAFAISGVLTTDGNDPNFKRTNTQVIVHLERDDSSPTNEDLIGRLNFRAQDSAGNVDNYAQIQAVAQNVTSASENGRIEFNTFVAGVNGTRMQLANGLVVGSPTEGDKGVGTINAKAVYDDGSLLCLPLEDVISGTFDEAEWRDLAPYSGVDIYKAMKAGGFDPASAQSFVDWMTATQSVPGYWSKAEWRAAPRISVAERMERLLLANDLQALAIRDLLGKIDTLEARVAALEAN